MKSSSNRLHFALRSHKSFALWAAVLCFIAFVGFGRSDTFYSVLDLTSFTEPGSVDESTRIAYKSAANTVTGTIGSASMPTGTYVFKVKLIAGTNSITESITNNYDTLYAILGPVGDQNLAEAIAALTPLNEANPDKYVMIVGPVVGDTTSVKWNPYVIFTQHGPAAELLTLLKYAVTDFHAARIGLAFTEGVSCGEGSAAQALTYLQKVGFPLSSVIQYHPKDTAAVSATVFSAYATASPSLTIVQGAPTDNFIKFLGLLMSDPRTSSLDILASSYQQAFVMNAREQHTSTMTGQLFFASSNPPPTLNPKSGIINKVSSGYNCNILNDYHTGNIKVGGALTIYLLAISALRMSSLNNFYADTSFFMLTDYLIGYYRGPSFTQTTSAPVEKCNVGGNHTLYFYNAPISGTTLTNSVPDVYTLSDLGSCGPEGSIPQALQVACINYKTDNPTLSDVYTRGCSALKSDPSPLKFVVGPYQEINSANYRLIVTPTDASSFSELNKKTMVDAITGPYDPTLTTSVENSLIWSPIYEKPQVNMYRKNEYHITPTFAQDILTLYGMMKRKAGQPLISTVKTNAITGIIKGADLEQTYYMQEGIVALSYIWGDTITDVYIESTAENTDWMALLWREGYNILIGITAADLDPIVTFMKQSPNSGMAVYIPYRTMSLIYPTAKAKLKDVQDRVLTDSSSQYWVMSNSDPIAEEMALATEMMRAYPFQFLGGQFSQDSIVRPIAPSGTLNITHHGQSGPTNIAYKVTCGPFMQEGDQLPLQGLKMHKIRNWGAQKVLLATGTVVFTNQIGRDAFYPDDFLYQSLTWTTTTTSTTTKKPKLKITDTKLQTTTTNKNLQATSTNTNLQATSTKKKAKPTTTTSEPTKKPANLQKIMFFVLWGLALAFILALLITLIFVLCSVCPCCVSPGAPSGRQVTLICMDVAFGPGMWTEMPNLEREAMRDYEKIVRSLIRKYNCYEVSWSNNQFVIASSSPYNAVKFGRDIHWVLFQHDWRTTLYDEWYNIYESRTNSHYQIPSNYSSVWNGLRVRVAIHSGVCRRYFVSSCGKYRYAGLVMQTASRTQELVHSGQTLVTESTWDCLKPEQIAMIDHTSLPPQNIRGEDNPLVIYSLNVIPGRQFGAIRQRDGCRDIRSRKFNVVQLPKVEVDYMDRAAVNKEVLLYGAVLLRCYENMPPEEAVDELLPLAADWNIFDSQESMDDTEYRNHLIEAIARAAVESLGDDVNNHDAYDNPTIFIPRGQDADVSATFNDDFSYENDDTFSHDTEEPF